MDVPRVSDPVRSICQEILGYLNFSSGTADPRFLHNLDLLWNHLESSGSAEQPAWQLAGRTLSTELEAVHETVAAFAQVDQARTALELTFERALPAYRDFHRDLLFHQPDEALFRPYFVGRVCEAVLREMGEVDDPERILAAVLDTLNDFVGHRPVAVLRTPQKIEPYPHEWVRPIPWFVAGAGVASGRYHDVIEQALQILQSTDGDILQEACFDPAALDELAIDPRAYDFEHPVNKRPNYHFGQWDPHAIDNRGRYHRFVLVQSTLDALLERLEGQPSPCRSELLYEAAAALAGTMLMASGISGSSPQTFDSSVSLASLLPRIAAYRDSFYQRLLDRLSGSHGERLRSEAASLKQPFGGARQHLNQRLARRRADQLQRVHLAQVYAQMGYPDAAERQTRIVPVAAARIACQLNCHLSLAHLAIERQQLESAAAHLPQIEDLLRRGIDCGAIVDPWNILGFQGQFGVFQALENSVRDYRVDELLRLMRRIFGLYAQVLSEASAAGCEELERKLVEGFRALTQWWDQFASTEVSSVEGISGRAELDSAVHVARALAAWHRGGASSGDVAFWREHVLGLDSPKAYAVVVGALLEKRDLVAARALLVHWASRGDEVPLELGEHSFHPLAMRWMCLAQEYAEKEPVEAWSLVRRFFDYLEANAEVYWDVPQFQQEDASPSTRRESGEGQSASDNRGTPPETIEDAADEEQLWPDDAEDVFSAAYEEMQFRDSAADGHEGDMLESGGPSPTELEIDLALRRFEERLAFLTTLARLWKLAATGPAIGGASPADTVPAAEVLGSWLERAVANEACLMELLAVAHRQRIPPPTGSRESLLEYDRRRVAHQTLEERIISTSVETAAAARHLRAAAQTDVATAELPAWEQAATSLLRWVLRGDVTEIRSRFPDWLELVREQPLLYIPLASKGDPRQVVAAQNLQHILGILLSALPRLGLFLESCRLLETAQDMESEHPVGKGAVTEFDRLFRIALKAQVESLVDISAGWTSGDTASSQVPLSQQIADSELIECLEPLTESLLRRWLMHSRSLRLSVLEKAADAASWKSLVSFIETYGGDLFTQSMFHVGNLQAILHQGVDRWLAVLEAERPAHADFRLLDELDKEIPRDQAVAHIELVFEAVLENFAEYRDYNNIATQSDRGELLYMFLDLLRLKARYERVAWNLRPVFLAHEILVRGGRLEAAEMWRQGFSRKTAEAADWHLKRLAELTRKYGLHLPTIADRLAERFIRPLALDRIRALVRPAVDEVRRGQPTVTMTALEQEIQDFAETPTGAGFDVPTWIVALEQEVEQVTATPSQPGRDVRTLKLPQTQLSVEEVQQQIRAWTPAGEL